LFHRQGRYAEARHDYEAAMQRDPYHPNAYKNLAWLQATCPEAEFRHAGEALRNIQQAMELDAAQATQWFEILAAAYAEAGDFESALQWLEKSPESTNQGRMLESYRRREAWREPAQQAIAVI
jgi:tetratricopeptide (TPR) repeat protein